MRVQWSWHRHPLHRQMLLSTLSYKATILDSAHQNGVKREVVNGAERIPVVMDAGSQPANWRHRGLHIALPRSQTCRCQCYGTSSGIPAGLSIMTGNGQMACQTRPWKSPLRSFSMDGLAMLRLHSMLFSPPRGMVFGNRTGGNERWVSYD